MKSEELCKSRGCATVSQPINSPPCPHGIVVAQASSILSTRAIFTESIGGIPIHSSRKNNFVVNEPVYSTSGGGASRIITSTTLVRATVTLLNQLPIGLYHSSKLLYYSRKRNRMGSQSLLRMPMPYAPDFSIEPFHSTINA